MAFRLALIVLAVAMCHAEARQISRREEYTIRGGWHDTAVSEVPEKVIDLAVETLTRNANRDRGGVRSVEIVSARRQTVQGTNYEVTIRFHFTDCPSRASRQGIKDESDCFETCKAKVYHDLEDTIRVTDMSCVVIVDQDLFL